MKKAWILIQNEFFSGWGSAMLFNNKIQFLHQLEKLKM